MYLRVCEVDERLQRKLTKITVMLRIGFGGLCGKREFTPRLHYRICEITQ
jgi:hypothetical protein